MIGRFAILMILLVTVASCTSSSAKVSGGQLAADEMAEAAYRAEIAAVGLDMRLRLMKACSNVDPELPAWAQAGNGGTQCMREKIENAFNEPDGIAACAGSFDLGRHFACLAAGSYLNELRRNIRSPKLLSAQEWSDPTQAIKNTLDEAKVQAISQCISSSSTDCEERFLLTMFGIDSDIERNCAVLASPAQCLLRKSMMAFMRNRAMMIW